MSESKLLPMQGCKVREKNTVILSGFPDPLPATSDATEPFPELKLEAPFYRGARVTLTIDGHSVNVDATKLVAAVFAVASPKIELRIGNT